MAHPGELSIDELQGIMMFERASALLDRPIAALKKMRLDNLITTLERRGDKGAADFFCQPGSTATGDFDRSTYT